MGDTKRDDAGLISIDQARQIREQFGYRALIVVGVRTDGIVDVMSDAGSEPDCRVIGDYAQGQFGANLPLVPFQTWFGWGNRGRARALSSDQLAALGDYGRRYAQVNTSSDAEFEGMQPRAHSRPNGEIA